MGHSRPLFFFIRLFITDLIQLIINKIWWCLDSNRRSLVLEATALPTEQEPLPKSYILHQIANLQILTWKWFIKNGPIPASFCLFSSFPQYNFNNTNWQKPRWCAWDSNPQPYDGRCRQNHRAMAAARTFIIQLLECYLFIFPRLVFSHLIPFSYLSTHKITNIENHVDSL